MHTDTRSHYQTQAVQTASPAQLVLMLYDGALAALTRARQAAATEAVHRELVKAQDIVSELQVTLDVEQGGQIARSLAALYDFCQARLLEANLSKQLDGLDDVTSVLADLRAAWEQACCAPVAASA